MHYINTVAPPTGNRKQALYGHVGGASIFIKNKHLFFLHDLSVTLIQWFFLQFW